MSDSSIPDLDVSYHPGAAGRLSLMWTEETEYAVEKCAVSSRTTSVKSAAVFARFDNDIGLGRAACLNTTGSKTVGSSSDVGNGWVEPPLYGAGVEQMIGDEHGWYVVVLLSQYAVRGSSALSPNVEACILYFASSGLAVGTDLEPISGECQVTLTGRINAFTAQLRLSKRLDKSL